MKQPFVRSGITLRMSQHYESSGPAPARLLCTWRAGKKIPILERGPFMPQEKLNWGTQAIFLHNRYHTTETGRIKYACRGMWVFARPARFSTSTRRSIANAIRVSDHLLEERLR